MTDAERTELAALRALPAAEFTREHHKRVIELLRDGRRLAHDISAAAAAKRSGKGKRKAKKTEAIDAPAA